MDIEIKFKSVAWRWALNVLLIMFLIVVAVEIMVCVFIRSYYHSQAKNVAEEYASSFVTPISYCLPENYEATARDYCEEFLHKDKLEIQVLDSKGNLLISTTGFSQAPSSMPDFQNALSGVADGYWEGKSSVGESVLCKTVLLYDSEDQLFGAVRWITSLENINSQVFWTCLFAISLGIVVLTILFVTGMYFIRSIVRPVRDVSSIARKMALGDFDSRIELKANNEIGELCDSINYMASELKSAENLKNDFISSVSHELRTPLTAIRGWAETAKMSVGYDEETVNKGLDVVIKESERLHSLVEELLDFSRMQSGRLSMNVEDFNLAEILDEAADMYRELAKKQKVDLAYVPPKYEISCHGDANRIKQVFINVIDNALKYNQPGGQILIEQHFEDSCVQISISDTGVGIAERDIDRVKEKFYKANKQVRGSGIGLAVADEIIKQHNGLLLVNSTEGVGTTVTIVLPAIQNPREGEKNEQ